MKPLNRDAIDRAYRHFLGWFIVLMAFIALCIYGFLSTLSSQTEQLSQQQVRNDEILFRNGQLAEKTDSLYKYLNLLNTSLIRYDQPMQRLISNKKEELTALMAADPARARHYVVYHRLPGYVNEMLLLKDSIRRVEADAAGIRQELADCARKERN